MLVDLDILPATPEELRERVATYRELADFCAGEGNLVVAAELRQIALLHARAELGARFWRTPTRKRNKDAANERIDVGPSDRGGNG